MEIPGNILFTGYSQLKQFNKLYKFRHLPAQLQQDLRNSPLLFAKEQNIRKKTDITNKKRIH
jgi:hypothetical protein